MTTWAYFRACDQHGLAACDCQDVFKHDLWRLTDDCGNDIGSVQQFQRDAPFYGNTIYGRTGAMSTLARAQAAVELMLERQKPGYKP